VVPLPAGVRGRWEGWSVQVWSGAAAADLGAWGHAEMQDLMWRHFPTQSRTDRRQLLPHESSAALGLTLEKSGPPPTPPKPRRVCHCGCGRTIPATARANKHTFNQVCRNRLSLQRKAA